MTQLPPNVFKDSLGRHKRNSPVAPSEDPRPLNKTHLRLLEFIHLFGGFSTIHLIHKFAVIDGITKQKASKYISKELFEVMFRDNGVVKKPEDQFLYKKTLSPRPESHFHSLVYRITNKGEDVLKGAGLWSEYAPSPHGWYKHQMMTACMYQIFYFSAVEEGIVFIPQHKLQPKQRYILVDGKIKVFPDATFVLNYEDRPALFFFELDRANERGGKDSLNKSWAKSIGYYKKILRNDTLYSSIYTLPKNHTSFLAAMTVDSEMRAKILNSIKEKFPKGHYRMLVNLTRAFGATQKDFFPPNYFNVLAESWERSIYPSQPLNRR